MIDVLSDLFILRGVPGHIRSDNGPSSSPRPSRNGSPRSAQRPPTSTPGSPWENGYIESFNARLRDELLNGEIFYTLREAQIVIESWRRHYNTDPPARSRSATGPRTGGVRASARRVAGLRYVDRLRRPRWPHRQL